MRKYTPSNSFLCKALYDKGYTFIFTEWEYKCFVSYAFYWHITTFAKRSGNVWLVILPYRKPNLVRKYIDPDWTAGERENKQMNLGDNCKECLCSKCRMLDFCNELDGRTDWMHCHVKCKGKGEPTRNCWQFEERIADG